MKKFIKNNILIIISILILIIWFLFGLNNFMKHYYELKSSTQQAYDKCQQETVMSDNCISIKNNLDSSKIPPAPLLFIYILVGGEATIEMLSLIAIIFVAVPAIWHFYQDTKSGMFKNKLTRQSYKRYFLNHYKKSLKCILILPIFLLITFFIVCCISKFKFQYQLGEMELWGDTFWSERQYARSLWLPYFSTMIFSLMLHSIYYINTAYLIFYKSKNFIVNIIGVYLCYLFTQTTIVTFLGRIFGRYLKMGEFAIALSEPEVWVFGSEINHFEYIIYTSIIYVIVSSLIMFILYHKKERYVTINER